MLLLKITLCFALLVLVLSRPGQKGSRPLKPGKSKLGKEKDRVVNVRGKTKYLKNDMGLNRGQYKKLYGKDPEERFNNKNNKAVARRSAAIADSTYYWPNARVPIVKNLQGFDATEKADFERVVKFIENVTCLTFPAKTSSDKNWAKIEDCDYWDVGCWSYLGMEEQGSGEQPVCLGNGCKLSGTFVHELGHLVGLMHEQERSDRDDSIIIHWENIERDGVGQFEKARAGSDVKSAYDFASTMHYGRTFFSKDGSSYTISAKNAADNSKFVDTDYKMFDFYDSMILNSVYKCAASCGSQFCDNGYMDKNCNCVTPTVLSKYDCNDINDTSSECEPYRSDCDGGEWQSWMEYYCKKTCNLC